MPRPLASALLALGLVLVGLPALARAADYEPPGIGSDNPSAELAECPSAEVPIVSEEEAEAVTPELRELGHLRIEQQESCRALSQRLDQLVTRLWWVVSESHHATELLSTEGSSVYMIELLKEVRDDLQHEDGLHVRLSQLPELPEGSNTIGTVDVGSSPSDGEVVAAVNEGTDTSNQNLWALAGMFLGFGLIAFLWRLMRP